MCKLKVQGWLESKVSDEADNGASQLVEWIKKKANRGPNPPVDIVKVCVISGPAVNSSTAVPVPSRSDLPSLLCEAPIKGRDGARACRGTI